MTDTQDTSAEDRDSAIAERFVRGFGAGIPTETAISSGTSPVMDAPYDPQERIGQTPGFFTQTLASLPRETSNRVRFFAGQIFPELTTAEAMGRFGFREGRIYYINRDGEPVWAEPDFDFSADPNELIHNVPALGRALGPALPTVGGIIGGAATVETGPGSIGGAMAGGAVGEGLRQSLGSFVGGGNEFDPWRIGGAAITEGAGQGVGLVGGHLLRHTLGRIPAEAVMSAGRADATAARISGPNQPFILTRAQASGNRALVRREQLISQSGTEGGETLREFYRIQNAAAREAVETYLGRFTQEPSVQLASDNAVAVANAAVRRVRGELSEAARPYYDAAYEMTDPARGGRALDTEPILRFINQRMGDVPRRGPLRQTLSRVQDNLAAENGGLLSVLDAEKKALDAQISAAGSRTNLANPSSSVSAGNIHYLTELRDVIVSEIDRQLTARGSQVVVEVGGREVVIPPGTNPYAVARNIFQEGVGNRAAAENGLLGRVADLEGNNTLRAAGILFNPNSSSVEQIRAARNYMIGTEGGEQAWNDLVGAWMRNALVGVADRAPRGEGVPNVAEAFANAMARNGNQQNLLIAATEHNPEMQAGYRWLMEAFDAASRVPRGGSQTAILQQVRQEMQQEGRNVGSNVVRGVSNVVTPSRWGEIMDTWGEGRLYARTAELLTTPEGLAQLRAAREVPGTSRAAVLVLGHLLTGGTVTGLEAATTGPADRQPTNTLALTGGQ